MTVLRSVRTIGTVWNNDTFLRWLRKVLEKVAKRNVVIHLEDLLHLPPSETEVTTIEERHAHRIIKKLDKWQVFAIRLPM